MSDRVKHGEAADSLGAAQFAPLLQAIYSADICVLYQMPDLRYAQAENLPAPLQAKWHKNCREADLFPPAIAAQMEYLKKQLLAGGQPAKLEVRLPQPRNAAAAFQAAEKADAESAAQALKAEAEAARRAMAAEGSGLSEAFAQEAYSQNLQTQDGATAGQQQNGQVLWFKFCIEAHRNAEGEILGITTTGVNISELRVREEVLKVLLREVSHRSKNLLAIIQSIAAQTARFSHTIGSFLKKFQGRLLSLSFSQDLVTESDWRGARLQDLIFAQTRLYTEAAVPEKCAVSVAGENPYLFPSAALHIGLALHELTINSASFGALAKGAGRIRIRCQAAETPADAQAEQREAGQEQAEQRQSALVLSWRESFPPDAGAQAGAAAEALPQAHFGSAVLERIVPVSVDGEAKYTIRNGEIEYSLTIPPEQFAYKEE